MARALIRGSSQILAGSIFDAQIAGAAAIQTSKLADGASFFWHDGSIAFSGNIDAGGFKVTNAGDGVAGSDLVTLSQLQDNAAGLDPKESVVAATTPAGGDTDVATGGLLTIDGITLSSGDRVLVKDQTDPIENGIYAAAAGAWVRTEDFDGTPVSEVSGGARTYIETGTVNADTAWVVIGLGNRVVGTDDIVFTQYTGSGSFTAGLGLGQTGSDIYVNPGDGIIITGDDVTVELDGSTLKLSAAGVALADLTDGQILVGNVGNVATGVTMIGDVSIANDGTATIANGAVTDAKVAAGAAIATSKLADGAEFLQRDGSVVWTGNADAGAQKITNLQDGTAAQDAATFGQVEGIETGLQTEIDAIETGAGLSATGTYVANTGNYINAADFATAVYTESLNNADRLLDAAIKANADAITLLGTGSLTAIQDEIDAIELSMGIGLVTTGGVFVGYTTTNYMDAAISLDGLFQALDAQIKSNEDDIILLQTADTDLQTEIDAIETGTGLNTDGTFIAYTGTNFVNASTSIANAITELDTNIQTALDAKLDDSQLIDDDTFATATATNIPSAESTKAYVDGQIALETVGFVDEEDLTGTIDGVATAFTVAGTPEAGSTKLYFNGQRLREGATNDFTLAGSTITTLFVPESGDQMWVDYRIA